MAVLAAAPLPPAEAQFRDDFDALTLATDRSGLDGWSAFAGDGDATITLRQPHPGHASIVVDASRDRRNVWWALIKRKVSDRLDLHQLGEDGFELRIEARIRVSHAPRRVNLHLNTRRTTDFHSHLMEFDIPETGTWHTISLTTRGFDARAGDTVFAQLALMDWGRGSYQVDVDYFHVAVVDPARAGPDAGAAVPYHPPVPDVGTFRRSAPASHAAIVDRANPRVNLDDWYIADSGGRRRVLTVNGSQFVILRFDLAALAGRRATGGGLLELTSQSVQRAAGEISDFGIVRVVEILGGDPAWDQASVTLESFCRGEPLDRVLSPQMIIDWPVTEGDGGKTYFTISRPVLQRMLDGRTLGLAIRPLGAISASFYTTGHADEAFRPRLLLNVE